MRIEDLYALYQQYPSVQTDTRQLKKGDLFFALKGDNFNGNQFAAQAIEQGASHAIIDEKAYEITGRTILVNDVLGTLQELARHHRMQFQIPFLAVTGSNGKTTTKELIHAVLSTSYITYTTQGNLNNHIGIPLTLLKIKSDAQVAVIEMGANHIGEIASYCRYVLPTHGLITNAGKAHLEGFGSVEGVRKGKGELFDHLRSLSNGTAFVMWDYPYLHEMSQGIHQVIRYGSSGADLNGSVRQASPFLEVAIEGADAINTQLVGDYNFPNVLGAVCIGQFFKVPQATIKQAIENYAPSNSRSQLIHRNSNTIILDAYNANPSSMKVAIENFAKLPNPKKVLVLGAMAELGNDSLAEHEAIASLIGQHDWLAVVLVGGDFLKVSHPFISLSSSQAAREWISQQHFTDTAFLVKGSRSMQMEKVLA